MIDDEAAEKLELIKQLFAIYLKVDPNRPDDWYGEKFDKLSEMTLGGLQNLVRIQSWSSTKQRDKNVMI
jgi:hypothetical protein